MREVSVATQKFSEYARERRRRSSAVERESLAVFTSAHLIGSALREARLERGLTQQELANASSVTQADISRIERASMIPTLPTLLRLVAALDGRLAIHLDQSNKRRTRRAS